VAQGNESSLDQIRLVYQDLVRLRQKGDPGSLTLIIAIILFVMPIITFPMFSGGSSCTGFCGLGRVYLLMGAIVIFGGISLIFFNISRSQSSKYNARKKEIMFKLIELVLVPDEKLKSMISQTSRENFVIEYSESKFPELKQESKQITNLQTNS
tara:strand:- start:16 stop:477 length:462 start_codon:yes stop_codon:yes gene_type:complete